jgi:hypothetical protein
MKVHEYLNPDAALKNSIVLNGAHHNLKLIDEKNHNRRKGANHNPRMR